MEDLIPLEIPVTQRTIQLIKSYAALSGKGVQEVSETLGAEVSSLLDAKLKELIAYEVGATPASVTTIATMTTNHTSGYAQAIPRDQAMVEGIGDQEPEDISAFNNQELPKGGLTYEDIERDMEVDDPSVEAKAEPLDLVNMPDDSEDIMAEAVGYMDNRIAKRKKRFGQGKGRVTALNDRVLAEGAGS